jgi:hypothetical protein
MKDEKYLKSLEKFLISKINDCECFITQDVKELLTENLESYDTLIVSSVLSEGIWLKALPVIRKAKSFILLAVSEGPELNADIAAKYGAAAFFKLPLNSELFLAKVKEIVESGAEKAKIPTAVSVDMLEEISYFSENMDSYDYYTFFGLPQNASLADIKKKYIAMARKYHPDKFRNIPADIREKAYDITKRANEAYSVLMNPSRKVIYDKMLKENPDAKRFDFRIKVSYNETPEDTIQNNQARRFAILATKAIEVGDYKSALTQLKMAASMEKNNAYIDRLIEEVSQKISK